MSKKIISSTIITLILLTTVIYARGAYSSAHFTRMDQEQNKI